MGEDWLNSSSCDDTQLLGYEICDIFVTEFWKITHMGVPETIRIFEFSLELLIAETTFKNISKLYL